MEQYSEENEAGEPTFRLVYAGSIPWDELNTQMFLSRFICSSMFETHTITEATFHFLEICSTMYECWLIMRSPPSVCLSLICFSHFRTIVQNEKLKTLSALKLMTLTDVLVLSKNPSFEALVLPEILLSGNLYVGCIRVCSFG